MTKPTKWPVHPAKTRISLGIRPVWLESSLSTWRNIGSLPIEHTVKTPPRLIFSLHWAHRLICWFCHAQAHVQCNACVVEIELYYCCDIVNKYYMSPVKRICVFEHSVITNFNCACPALQRGQGSGFLSEGSSWLTACMSEQRRFWRDWADAQARLNLRCSEGSGKTVRMRRLAWTFAARICDKYQIHLTRSIFKTNIYCISVKT